MRILITGGTGFIGYRLALRCLELGHEVRVFSKVNNPAEAQNKAWVEDGTGVATRKQFCLAVI